MIAAGIVSVLLGAYVWKRPGLVPVLRAGQRVPDFTLAVHGGDSPVSLASLRGKVALVHFWATWCAPCQAEAPSLERLYEKLRGEGFEIAAISLDEPDASAAVDAFRNEHSLTFPILLDPTKGAFESYLVWGLPETFLIDRAGTLVDHFIGPVDWDDPRYTDEIRGQLERGRIGP